MQQTLYQIGHWRVTQSGLENIRTGYFLRRNQVYELYDWPRNDPDFLQALRRARETFTPTFAPRSNKQKPEGFDARGN